MKNNTTIHSWEWKLTFGKFKGHTLGDVFDDHFDYIVWAYNSIDWFRESIKKDPEFYEEFTKYLNATQRNSQEEE